MRQHRSMKKIRRILVAIKNPEARPQLAFDRALQLAKAFGASLELYHAIVDPVYVDPMLTAHSLRDLTESRVTVRGRRLESLAARAREQQIEAQTTVDWDFPPYEAIVRRALVTGADLIVAECHHGRRFAPWLVHLTDWELLRTSHVPVLLVRGKEPYEKPIVLAAVDPTHAHAKPEMLDNAILALGGRFARALSGSLHAMHAYYPVPLDVPTSAIRTDSSAAQLYREVRGRARTAFERTTRQARISRARRHLIDRNPVAAIPATAREIGADLVVMGAVSRSGLERVLIGNTAERALGAIHCDVLVVKPPRFASTIAQETRGVRMVTPHVPFAY
jgi:universal stress protein E